MNKLKRITAITLAALILALFVGCEKKPEPANDLERVLDKGVLTVAVSPDFPPMEFLDVSAADREQYVGFDISLAEFIASELGVELRIEAMGFDEAQEAVYTRVVPMSISGYSRTAAREESFEISDNYFAGESETDQVLIIRREDAEKYSSISDLAGLGVGAQENSLQMDLVISQLPESIPVSVSSAGKAVHKLRDGDIAALAVSGDDARTIINSESEFVIMDEGFVTDVTAEAFVIILSKGETELLARVNEALAKARDGGFYAQWYAQALEQTAAEVTVSD